LAATACAGSTPFAKAPQLAAPDRELTRDCADPTVLPDRELTQAEVERYWGEDRFRLAVCRDRNRGLLRFFTFRDDGLRKK
jgi:hypothetical protein